MTEIRKVLKFEIRILFKIKTCLPPACPAYRQAGGRQGRQVKN